MKFLLLFALITIGGFLRIFNVDQNPPGLYIDEVSIGVNAYEILTRGVDEHGVSFPLFFEAFGEYKMPAYIYLVSGAMAVVGKIDLAVRLPSIIFGILTIPLLYLFIRKLIELNPKQIQNNKFQISKFKIPIVAAALLALSPWHIHFSRAGFEANVALFIFLLGSYFGLLFWSNKKYKFLILCFIFFSLTLYTYNAYRVISPLMVLIISLFIFLKFIKFRKKVVAALIGFALLILPVVQFSMTEAGATRFDDVSAFTKYEDRSSQEKLKIYPMEVMNNYFSYFSLEFLFSTGDNNNRHQLPGFGLVWRWLIPFTLIGFYQSMHRKNKLFKYSFLTMLLLAPLPASIVQPNPHSLRSLLMVLPLTVFAAYGLVWFFEHFKKYKLLVAFCLLLISFYEFSLFMHNYYFHYPRANSPDWGAGYKQMTLRMNEIKSGYDHIVVDQNLSNASSYIDFYGDGIEPLYVDTSWTKPDAWDEEDVLYVRPFYGNREGEYIIENIYLPQRDDIHAQFWKL